MAKKKKRSERSRMKDKKKQDEEKEDREWKEWINENIVKDGNEDHLERSNIFSTVLYE